MEPPAALGATEPSNESIKGEAHRDAREPAYRSKANHPATWAEALNVGVALGGELFDAGVRLGVIDRHEAVKGAFACAFDLSSSKAMTLRPIFSIVLGAGSFQR